MSRNEQNAMPDVPNKELTLFRLLKLNTLKMEKIMF